MVKVQASNVVVEVVDVDPFENLLGPAPGPAGEEAAGDVESLPEDDAGVVTDVDEVISIAATAAADAIAEATDEAASSVVVIEDDGQPEPPAPACAISAVPGCDGATVVADGWAVTASSSEQSEFARRMHDAESVFLEASLELSALKSQLDELKSQIKEKQKEVDGLALNLRSMRERGEDQLDLFDRPVTNELPTAPVTSPAGLFDQASPPATTQPPQISSDSWRAVPIAELGLLSIKGLGKKKFEAISNVAGTIGELEDLRAKWGGLTNIDSIGPEMQTAIEDKLIEWLSANRDSDALRAARGEVAADPEPVNQEPADAEGDSDEEPAVVQFDPDSRTKHVEQVTQAAEELRGADLKPSLAGESHWRTGYDARQAGAAVDVCPFSASDAQADWLKGWLTADHELSEGSDAEEAS